MAAVRHLFSPPFVALSAALALGGCATLPSSGPTAHDITRAERAETNKIGFRIVPVDEAIVQTVTAEDKTADSRPTPLATLNYVGTNDTLGPGDVLQISVFEVGVSLFGSGQGLDTSARGQALPPITVDRNGSITIPYAGRIQVAGHTPGEVESQIEKGLRGISQKPQALVTVRDSINNTAILFGEIRRPGRYSLTLGHERLLDAIALGGGSVNSAEDTIVRVTRGTSVVEDRLGRIRSGDPGDILLAPGDRIELIRRPRTFLILGASTKVSQVPFETGDVSLAEAVARAGGPTDAAADPSAVFLFRYDPKGIDGPAAPMVYRLNMMNPASYFLAQRFFMRDKDVIYIGNAAANQPSKLISIINQLFSPFVTARVLTQ